MPLKQRGMDGNEPKRMLEQRGIQPTVSIGLMLVKITISKTLPGNAEKFHLVRKHLRVVLKMHVTAKIPKQNCLYLM